MIVLRRFVRDRRRSLVGWSVGISAYVLLQNAFYPTIKDQPDFSELFENMPEGMKAIFGISDAVPLLSPAGWIHGQVFVLLPVLIAIFAISAGTRALATSEEDGTLELLLANPIQRLRAAGERYGAFVFLTTALGIIVAVFTMATMPPLQLIEGISIPGYLAASFGMIGLGLLFGSITFGVGALTGRRSLAISVGATIAIATYTIRGLAESVPAAHGLRLVSPFHWLLGRNMLAQGIAVEALVLPIAFAALFAGVGLWGFGRRDLQTT